MAVGNLLSREMPKIFGGRAPLRFLEWHFLHVPANLLLAMILLCFSALYIAFRTPVFFSNPQQLGELIFAELLAAVLWKYRERFFPVLILAFFWAGTALPLREIWTTARWFVLGAGAAAGALIHMKNRCRSFGIFHFVAFACILAATTSALVSAYPQIALLKTGSLLLLFLYAATGGRLTVIGSEQRFFSGLLLACEILVHVTAISYLVLHVEIFGNRNSLGAAMGVVALPMLLWGILVSRSRSVRHRRIFALLLSLLLLLGSYERAGIVAAAVSSTLLCISLRRYRILFTGILLAVAAATVAVIFVPLPTHSDSDDRSLTSRYVYKGRREGGVFESRRSVWDQTVSSLLEHPWFGTGFGTSATLYDKAELSSTFSSPHQVTREHGNSYLEIAEWVGLLGALPFVGLMILILVYIARVVAWMRQTSSPFSPAVPVAVLVVGALVNAGFEDWLFAVGYPICVLFWALAFILPDCVQTTANRSLQPV